MAEPAAPPPLARRWSWRLLAAFVTGTLVALVIIPLLVQRRVDALRRIHSAGEPARTLVRQWQLHLVQQYVALSELALTEDSALTTAYDYARAMEQARADELERYVTRLGYDVPSAYDSARTLVAEWHEDVDVEARRRGLVTGRSVLNLERRDNRFAMLLDAVAHVDDEILRATANVRANIDTAERQGLLLTITLGVFALISAIIVIVLEERVRTYAMEAVQRQKEADEAVAALVRASEARASLIRGITHDVKNPLGTAKGYAELLEMGVKGRLGEEQVRLVEGVERSIDSALEIIADLLDLADPELSNVSVEPVEVDLTDIVRDAADDHAATARTSGHDVEVEVPESPLTTETDPARVRQVLDNVLSNAIKYTPPPGHITVRAERAYGNGAPGPGPWYAISVTDTGPGIRPEHREAIFDEFVRFHEDSNAKGHGLGLPVARSLARRLGGDLTLAGNGPGATFVLWLPEDTRRIQPSEESRREK